MNQWFRMYSEFEDDPKVRFLSETMQIRLVWLFCEKCKGVTMDERHRAFHWRCSDSDLSETKDAFMNSGFIDSDWNLLNWDKRQYISDSSSERTRRYRERKRTSQERHSGVTVTPPDTNTDTEKIQKPSRAKAARGKKTEAAKSRHTEFKAAILRYWESKNPGVEMPWGPAEGRNLEMWLRETPNTTLEQFVGYLRNRFKSAVTHTERPSRWIGNVTIFASGPIDKYGKPLQESANVGSEKNQRSPASQRVEANLRAVAETAVRRGWVSADNFERPDAAEMAEPGPGGIDR